MPRDDGRGGAASSGELDRDLAELRHLLIGESGERIEALEARVGDDRALEASTRRIIVETLRKAGENDHQRLADTLAPLVLESMRSEIKASSGAMVDALYPIVGRLVAASVRNAFVELTEKINRALESSLSAERWKIRLQALATGRPEAELLLAKAAPYRLDAFLVIHRPTGLLIAAAGGAPSSDGAGGAPDPDLVSGMLTAILTFAEDAFASDPDQLRSLEFAGSEIFIRASPAIVLATRVVGASPGGLDQRIDAVFTGFLERWGSQLRGFDGAADEARENAIAEDLRGLIGQHVAPEFAGDAGDEPSRFKLYAAAALIALALAGWGVWSFVETYHRNRDLAAVNALINADPVLRAHPLRARYDAAGDMIVVRGLAPDADAMAALREEVSRAGIGLPIRYEMQPVRVGGEARSGRISE